MKKIIPQPNKVRRMPEGYGWLDHRLLRSGWIEEMSLDEFALYAFLAVASGPEGVSYYRKGKICKLLKMDLSRLNQAFRSLLRRGLVAFAPFSQHDPDGFHQLLDLPPGPAPPSEVATEGGLKGIGHILQQVLGGEGDGRKPMGGNTSSEKS